MSFALMVNCLMGATCASVVGADPLAGAGVMSAIGIVCGNLVPQGAFGAGVYTEVWTGELVKYLRRGLEATWLDGIPDNSSIVENDVIHLVEVGVDPDVLVNNTTYPIPLQALDDQDIAISLDKFQTTVTPITDDELYAISYDKMTRVKESHGNAIKDTKFAKAAHAMCANSHTAKTPVLATTGPRDPETGRRMLIPADLIRMKKAMDKLRVPTTGRRLVLCSDHVNDLLAVDQKFKEQYNIDRNNGTVGRLYGFDIYEFANNPLYTTAGVKKAVGATAETGEFQCSFAFYTQRVFKATGSTKMYYSPANTDPQNQRNLINFRHMFICMPKKQDAGVVMMSAYSAQQESPEIYNFESYNPADHSDKWGEGKVAVLSQSEGKTKVIVLENSVEGFAGRIFVIDAVISEPGTFYALMNADGTSAGIDVKISPSVNDEIEEG